MRGKSAVQVHNMQPACSLLFPLKSGLHMVFEIYRLFIRLPLLKAHSAAVLNINGRK